MHDFPGQLIHSDMCRTSLPKAYCCLTTPAMPRERPDGSRVLAWWGPTPIAPNSNAKWQIFCLKSSVKRLRHVSFKKWLRKKWINQKMIEENQAPAYAEHQLPAKEARQKSQEKIRGRSNFIFHLCSPPSLIICLFGITSSLWYCPRTKSDWLWQFLHQAFLHLALKRDTAGTNKSSAKYH